MNNPIPETESGADNCSVAAAPRPSANRRGLWGMVVAVIVGFFASLCCVGPLLLIFAGIGGAWMGGLRILGPYAPYLDIVALLFLGYAHFQNYRERKAIACGTCSPVSRWKTPLLWAGTILLLIVLALPHVLPGLLMS